MSTKRYLKVVLICISLITNNIKRFFIGLLGIYTSLVKVCVQGKCNFYVFVLLIGRGSLRIFDKSLSPSAFATSINNMLLPFIMLIGV